VFFFNCGGGMLEVGQNWRSHDIPSRDRGRVKAAKFCGQTEKLNSRRWSSLENSIGGFFQVLAELNKNQNKTQNPKSKLKAK